MANQLEITCADGSTERRQLDERVILGRRPKDGIAVPQAAELELEHLLLVPRKDGCWLSVVEGARTPALVRGQRLDGGVVPWGTEVQLGSVRLRLIGAAPDTSERASQTSPVTVIGMIGLLAAALWLFGSSDDDGLPRMSSVEAPALFEAKPGCPKAGAGEAIAAGREAAEAARAKSERYAFAAQDGVQAVLRYGEAAACFTLGGRVEDAATATSQRDRLEARIVEDYRTHQLRLERALKNGQTRQALIEVRELLGLVAHLDHPYRGWLRAAERRLAAKVRRK